MIRLSIEGFLSFYQQACERRQPAVWDDLTVHGYTCDLRSMEQAAHEQSESPKYLDRNMPRVMLSKSDDVGDDCVLLFIFCTFQLPSRSRTGTRWGMGVEEGHVFRCSSNHVSMFI